MNVLPQNLCDSHATAYPQFCLTGDDCCMDSPPAGCSTLHFARSIGMGFTTDHTQTGKTFTWSHGACNERNTLCCQDQTLIECVECMNEVDPGELCSDHGDDFPQFCAPPPPVDVCGHANGFPTPAVIRNSHSDRRMYARVGDTGEDDVGADAGGTVHDDQKWYIEDAGNGAYSVRNYHSDRRLFAQDNSNMEIGVGAMATGNLWADQKWYIDEDVNCKYVFRNYHSGRRLFAQENKIWEDGVGAMASGRLWADQKWYIEEA